MSGQSKRFIDKQQMKFIYTLFFFVLFLSCDQVSDTELDGKWQLQQVVKDGIREKVDTIYYNFQNTLFQYQIYNATTDRYPYAFGYKTKNSDSGITLELISYPHPIDTFLPQTDWKSRIQTFRIEKKTSNQLILSCEGTIYTFRKF